MEYFAHSENGLGEKHLLSKHLQETAKVMETFACKDLYGKIFYLTGLLHDLGKYQPEFQKYLEGNNNGIPHASWGAGYARILRNLESSIPIDGHHKGLPDNSAWKSDTNPYVKEEISRFSETRKAFINDSNFNESDVKNMNLRFADPLKRELFIRYLFSSLIDSDRLSTEKHFDPDKYASRIICTLQIDEMIQKLNGALSKKPGEGEINKLRNEARFQALRKANMPCGFFSLTLPTGMGKTLTSISWALKHAKVNNLKRIIIVLPYINIIDQTAQDLKNIFGQELVLEHHSSYNEKDSDRPSNAETCSNLEYKKELACENWDYPIIVTTTVQFFESLFSNKTSKCRKIHNIAESIVIFDEVQSIPKEIILPTLQMLKDIREIMNTSFLFCTATLPAFEKRPGFNGIDAIESLINDPKLLYDKTKRVKYHLLNNLNPIVYNELLEAVTRTENTALVIFNTKKAALEFYNLAKILDLWEEKYHLSTTMCPSHRKIVVKNIRNDLRVGKKILVVSTQLIEAGVDFDFPIVFRAMAPLEAVIQSAGRCNREGKLGELGGNTFLFKLQDGGMPDKTYTACAGHAEDLIKHELNRLYEHSLFNEYYSQVISLYVDPDKYKVNEARKQFNYETVNDCYRIIRNNTESMFIYLYSDESRRLFDSIQHKEFLSKDDYRKMQQFTVQVYNYFIIQNAPMCKIMPQGFMVWFGNYDVKTGISAEPIDADKLII